MSNFATISECGKYRYSLGRRWDSGPSVLFIMLNPSTADADKDDPTIKKCISLAKNWGYGSLVVGNLYAYRSTDPQKISSLHFLEAQGPKNTTFIKRMLEKTSKVVVAWGNQGAMGTIEMNQALKRVELWCLQMNKNGSPKHPLYCKSNSKLKKWEP